MTEPSSRRIIIAGGGIAGLSAALAFARHGFSVRVLERAEKLEEAGAGIQLSPNATRLLDRLGVLDALKPVTVRPKSVVLRDGATLRELAHVPLGAAADARWGAPYLVVHRADLQSALLGRIAHEGEITLDTGAVLCDAAFHPHGVTVAADIERRPVEIAGLLLVGADGVHSTVRRLGDASRTPRFAGEIAWRVTVTTDGTIGRALQDAVGRDVVTAFLRPGFHLIAYPVRAGAAINLVAFTKAATADGRDGTVPDAPLRQALSRSAPALRSLADDGIAWTHWPIHIVDQRSPWTAAGVALIGDAAHAMTPYAAQGAAMAVEDAVTLAGCVAGRSVGIREALAHWEAERRPRIAAVARRAAINRLAWHAAGPVALVRNFILGRRSPERLAADMDWLYGWTPRDGG